MDPIIGGPVAAEVRSVEQKKPARPAPFRYNRAREQIKKAQEQLAQVKREARGQRGQNFLDEDKAFLQEVEALRVEFRAAETTDERRAEVRKLLHNYRPRVRAIQRSGWRIAPSLGALLLLPSFKAEIRAMLWAWATVRAIEVDSGLNLDPRIQLLPLQNGKWARIKLPEGDRVLRWEGSSPSVDIDDFRSWTAWNYKKSDERKLAMDPNHIDEPISAAWADACIKYWATAPKAEA